MPAYSDRTKDTTTTTGTGDVTLSGTPPTGFQSFVTAFNSQERWVGYAIVGGAEWEVGKGFFDGANLLVRDVVKSSSNSNALVNFSAGSKDVFVTAAAETLDNANVGHQVAQISGWALP